MIKRRRRDESEITNKLGFHIGASVRISRRYFSNHSVQYIDLGIGIIEGKTLPDAHTLPALLVRFPFHLSFFTEQLLKPMLETSSAIAGTISVLVKVHPAYLDAVKGRKNVKKN